MSTLTRISCVRRYLPEGVQMILVATVKPIIMELDFSEAAILRKDIGPRHEVVRLMGEVSSWNKKHERSFFQRVAKEYIGGRGVIAVFHRGGIVAQHDTVFDVSYFSFEDVPLAHTSRPLAARGRYQPFHLEPRVVREDVLLPTGPVELNFSGAPEDEFLNMARSIRDDRSYMDHVRTIIPYSNLVLADPRTFYGTQDLQRRLGSLGLNVLLDPEVEITPDVLIRIFLLADRLNTLFHFSAALHFEGMAAGTSMAFEMVTHSLGNALQSVPAKDKKTAAVLEIEKRNLEAAGLLSTRGPLSDNQLVEWVANAKHPPFEDLLGIALDRPAKSFPLAAQWLHGLKVDPRFMAVLIEIARNQKKVSKTRAGSIRTSY